MYKHDQPMGPPNMTLLERRCAICGKLVPKGRSLYCSDDCAKQAERDHARERYTPKSATRPGLWRNKTCTDCGNVFYGHIRSTRCPECQAAHKRETDRQVRERKRAGTTRPLGSTTYCERCGNPYIVMSGFQRYCKACSPIALRENKNATTRKWNREHYSDPAAREEKNSRARRAAPARNTCPICGKKFDAPNTRRKYCSEECRQQGRKQYWRAYDYVRRKPKDKETPPAE